MDLHLIPDAVATDAERNAIDAAIGGSSPRRDLLLPALHAAQASRGWISEGALNHICSRLDIPPAEAYGVASFYGMFALEPQPPTVVHVCDDVACLANGADALCSELAAQVSPAGQPYAGGQATWKRSPCLGLCEHAPVALVQRSGGEADSVITKATVAGVLSCPDAPVAGPTFRSGETGDRSGDHGIAESIPQLSSDPTCLRLLARAGRVDPGSLDAYRSSGGYAALRRAIELGPEGTLREIVDAKLVGRGGAAFPTGRKWEAVARNPQRPHYVVCNADESEPGTFKDRVLMEADPFALVEALTVAGFVTGAEKGYLYIRGEYPLATARLRDAIAEASRRGFLGENILSSGLRFDLELRRGAGAYICGEETALFNSLEGKRGEPRNKPPYPVNAGLFGRPTVVNNVETLINVLDILNLGGPAFGAIGTAASTGNKLFCVSGSIRIPGVYEIPFGMTLRGLLDLAGGMRPGRTLQGVLLGGAAGTFVTSSELDVPLTFEGTRAAGAAVGSGAVLVFDETVDMRAILLRLAAFFRDESCGQCVPCRVGTVRQEESLHRLSTGAPLGSIDAEVALIDDLALAMKDASICGLGHTASIAIQSGIRKLGVFRGA
jgi:NADH-quinone oxidoreductase subunit F